MPLRTYFNQCGTLACSIYPIPFNGHIPTKTPSVIVQSSGSEASSISSPLQVFSTTCFFNARGPNLILSLRIQSRRSAEFTVFSHMLWMLAVLSIAPGFVMTRLTRSFQIKCHPRETNMANNLPCSGRMVPLDPLNFTKLHPRISPQLSFGQEEYFNDHSWRVKDQIIFCSGDSHSRAICSRDSGALQTWQMPLYFIVSMWDQKSPTLKVLWIHFHKNPHERRWIEDDRIDVHIIVSDGV